MFLCAHGQTFPARIHHLSGLQHLVRQHNACLDKLHTCTLCLNILCPAACVVTALGSAPMKAAPVRETCSSSQCIHIFWAACTQWLCLCCLCEGECLVVGQSHFKTFDNKFFTFTGHCLYLLAKDCKDGRFSVIIENVQVMSMCF